MAMGSRLLLKMMSFAVVGIALQPMKRVAGFGVRRTFVNGARGFEKVANQHQCRIQNTALVRGSRFYFHDSIHSNLGKRRHGGRTLFSTKGKLRATGVQDLLVEDTKEQEDTYDSTNDDALSPGDYLPGTVDGFFVVKMYKTDPGSEFDMEQVKEVVESDDIGRLEMTPRNISIPAALMMLDPEEFPSRSRARKACRKANIMIHRGPAAIDAETGEEKLDPNKCTRARVGCRIYPGDVICKQVRIGDGNMPSMRHEKPPFDLPVVFEDDHFAIVNKPAGVVVYAKRGGGEGLMTMRAAIPFAVAPSKAGTYSTLRRPQPVHRLDKPTSGLLIIAKTKPAMVNLSGQFRNRKIKKTYTAIVNGIPAEPRENTISARDAHALGVDIDPDGASDDRWQLIDHDLEDKSAVTVWKALKYSNSALANENVLTTVEMKPKTGRFHQLRRHMSWVCKSPIIGDDDYDGGGAAMGLRDQGLFLCSNKVTLEHPYYNDSKDGSKPIQERLIEKEQNGLWLSPEGKVMVTASIELPEKFHSFVSMQNEEFAKLLDSKE